MNKRFVVVSSISPLLARMRLSCLALAALVMIGAATVHGAACTPAAITLPVENNVGLSVELVGDFHICCFETRVGFELRNAFDEIVDVYWDGNTRYGDNGWVYNWRKTISVEAVTYYEVTALNSNLCGVTRGQGYGFRTPAAAPSLSILPVPYNPYNPTITTNSATVQCHLSANGEQTNWRLDWGLTTNYGQSFGQVFPANWARAVDYTIGGLQPETTYHYRFWAQNWKGSVFTGDATFTTAGRPTADTGVAADLKPDSVRMVSTVAANGLDTVAWLEFGTTTNYGTVLSWRQFTPTERNYVIYPMTGLQEGHTYHFRVVASNAWGIVYGVDVPFTTPLATLLTNYPLAWNGTNLALLAASITMRGETGSGWLVYDAPNANIYNVWVPLGSLPASSSPYHLTNSIPVLPGATYGYMFGASNSWGFTWLDWRTFTAPNIVRPETSAAGGLEPGHHVVMRRANSGFGAVDSLGRAEALLAGRLGIEAIDEGFDLGVPVVNYVDTYQVLPPYAPRGNFSGDREFRSIPGLRYIVPFMNLDDFAVRADGFLQITQAGVWTFTVNSDDGFRLRLGVDGAVAMEVTTPRAPADSSVNVVIPAPGFYRYELLYFAGGGEAEVEFFASGPGQPTPLLVGDPAGAIRVFQYTDAPIPAAAPLSCIYAGSNPGHNVEFRGVPAAQTFYFGPTNITDAELVAAGLRPFDRQATDHGVSVINYTDGGGTSGAFGTDRNISANLTPVSGGFSTGDDDHFVMHSWGYLYIPTPGVWNFSVTSDDGFRLRLGTNNAVVAQYENPRGLATTTRAVSIPTAGFYPYDLVVFEQTGGAMVEFSARGPGQPASRLVGDAAGLIQVFRTVQLPRLSVSIDGGYVDVSWSSGCSGNLDYTTAALTNAVWQPADVPIFVNGRWHSYNRMTAGGGMRIFRLRP